MRIVLLHPLIYIIFFFGIRLVDTGAPLAVKVERVLVLVFKRVDTCPLNHHRAFLFQSLSSGYFDSVAAPTSPLRCRARCRRVRGVLSQDAEFSSLSTSSLFIRSLAVLVEVFFALLHDVVTAAPLNLFPCMKSFLVLQTGPHAVGTRVGLAAGSLKHCCSLQGEMELDDMETSCLQLVVRCAYTSGTSASCKLSFCLLTAVQALMFRCLFPSC